MKKRGALHDASVLVIGIIFARYLLQALMIAENLEKIQRVA
jgi:hypothetical protein